jgi:hypothetical protein
VSSHYYTEFVSLIVLNLRCNICSQEIDEKEIENHVKTEQHKENKSKISGSNGKGSDNSVVKMWQSSLQE